MRTVWGLVAVMAATVALPAPSPAVDAHRLPPANLQPVLDELVGSDAATSALARVRRGHSVWEGSAGVEDLMSRHPVDPDGHFRVGSVTKTFAATVVLQLVDEGVLSLDDPIERHLPGLVAGGTAITVRQLLNHTSGLFDYTEAPQIGQSSGHRREGGFRTYTPADLLAIAFAHDTYFAPGAGWRYSNTNYIVVGLLIEQLTGNPYGDEVERRILRPLHLDDTVVPGTDHTIPEPHAHGYLPVPAADGQPPRLVDVTEINPSVVFAAGEMISTTADLHRFYDALLGGDLLSHESLTAMRHTVATGRPGLRYGLGLVAQELGCGVTLWGHDGVIDGFLTDVTRADDGRQLAVSLNPFTQPLPTDVLTRLYETTYCHH